MKRLRATNQYFLSREEADYLYEHYKYLFKRRDDLDVVYHSGMRLVVELPGEVANLMTLKFGNK